MTADNKLFVPPGHYYSPVVDPTEAEKLLLSIARLPVPTEVAGIRIDRKEMIETWWKLLPFFTTADFPDTQSTSFRYFFDNPFYAWGDGSVLSAMLRYLRPRRLIEIGSGHTSACTVDTVEHYLDGGCEVTCIEPFTDRLRELLGDDLAKVRIVEKPVQDMKPSFFDQLEAGDILFIDSTHVMKTGSDVCFELFEILPRLAKGVIVHFHDMFWPFEYPREWAVVENRSWNELYGVRAFLTHNDAWEVVFFNDFFAKLEPDLIRETFPDFLKNTGGALWLRRKG